MAAGRCDSWLTDFHYFKKECDGHRNGYHDAGLSRGRVQQGGWSNSSGRSDGGFWQDKEYVELLGGGRSNNAFSFHSRARDDEFPKSETDILQPLAKKGKFSPIVWDREDEEIRISLKNRIVPTCSPVSPLSVPKSSENVQNVGLDEDVTINPVTPTQHHVATVYAGVDSSESPADSHALLHSEQFQDKEQELGYEVEEYIEARNISTSRWIHMENSPSEILSNDVGDMSIRRNVIHHVNSLKTVSSRMLLSPESGEFWKEGSGGSREKSSQSNGMYSMGPESPESGDESSENELDNHNFMSIDDTLDEHAEDDDNSRRIQQPTGIKHRRINMLEGCRSVFEYERLNKINEGTYGIVYRARDKKTGEVVALKKVKMGVERNDGFPLSSLREINILLSLHHPSIVDVKEVVMGDLDSVFMVMEYMEHDLKGLMEVMKQPFSQSEVKCLMLQLLEGVKYLHDNWVLHRDLKTSNLLLNNSGELKICDFGLSRQYGSPLKPYTPLVVTLWYRAPELLLETKQYSTAIDMWSVGCIMAELLAKEPLFSGRTKFDQLDKIFRTLGTPNETIWPGFSKLPGVAVNFAKQQYNILRKKFPAASFTGSPVLSDLGLDLLNRLLTYDPDKRITAEAALNHGWFREVPLPKSREFMPTFPAQHVQNGMTCSHRAFRNNHPNLLS